MRVSRHTWTRSGGWQGDAPANSDWVLFFGSPEALDDARYAELRRRHPGALLLGCTTDGEIGAEAAQGTISAMGVALDGSSVRGVTEAVDETTDARSLGARIGGHLAARDLRAIFVLSDSNHVNGTELVSGICAAAGAGVHVSGGLLGDGSTFGATRTGIDAPLRAGLTCAVGLYGNRIAVSSGTGGGWSPFGPKLRVTSAERNVLYGLDGCAALDLYKKSLGDEARDLPSSALFYPLLVKSPGGEVVARRIVGVDEGKKTLILAGDVAEGALTQIMRTSRMDLVDGAADAASWARTAAPHGFAVLASGIGRKLLLGPRTSEEVEAAVSVLGSEFPTIGFYSYGEIAPTPGGRCALHNDTIAITTFAEW